MKKIFLTILFLFLLSAPFLKAFAHGGVEQSAKNVIVTFFQDPFSPIVNKNTTLSFIISDKNSGKRIADYPLVLSVKETFYGDESKDKVFFTKNYKSDVNGLLTLNYIFPKDKIYDIELNFPKIEAENDEEKTVGFLLEPRNDSTDFTYFYVFTSIVFLFLGIYLGKVYFAKRVS